MADVLDSPEQVGRAAGALGGFLYGARAGTLVSPVVGTFMGGVLGALVGSGLGAPIGRGVSTGAKVIARSVNNIDSGARQTAAPRATPK